MSKIDFGYMSIIHSDTVTGGEIRTVAQSAEVNGFDGVSVPDHVVLPAETTEDYPLASSGEPPWSVSNRALEMFQVGTYIGAVTEELTITSNVAIAPWRHPVMLAKNILTLDFLTEGRFEFGAGTGWSRVEAETFDVPFDERGQRFDEFLALFEDICEEGVLASQGEFHSFDTTGFLPVPDDAVPILIGGWSGAAFRRVGQFGDGWTTVLSSPAEIRDAKRRMLNAWTDFDRDGEPEILLLHPVHIGDDATMPSEGNRLVGTPDQVIADIETYIEAGVTRLDILFRQPASSDVDLEEYQVQQLERFSSEVMPSF